MKHFVNTIQNNKKYHVANVYVDLVWRYYCFCACTCKKKKKTRAGARRMRNYIASTICRAPKRAKMPLAIPAVCNRKKKREREKERNTLVVDYSRGHSLNDSTILGHSSKRHNASSMTGNARFR